MNMSLLTTSLIKPIAKAVGRVMFNRLKIGRVFKQQLALKGGFSEINETFEKLVWNEKLPAGKEPEYLTVNNLGNFTWGDIRVPLQKSRKLFSNISDREAIDQFLEFEEVFKEQPNYLSLPLGEQADTYAQYAKYHLWCYNFMRNISLFGTNNFNYDGSGISEALPLEYGVELDKVKALKSYHNKNGVRFLDFNSSEGLPKEVLALLSDKT